ncbi:phosphoglycolate phosphatase [Parasalinivibrio latis]|uniref:phosphoglycolate phosphatase n=1 Tax=Parasalinivibrio latis TaxID=2952610 RepID=UPI0030DE396B
MAVKNRCQFGAVKYIAFDLDGTLIDSVPELAVAVQMAMTDLGRTPPAAEKVRTWVGNGADVLIGRALSDSIEVDPELPDALRAEARARFDFHYHNNGHEGTKVYDDVIETLQTLKASGYQLGIITNKPSQFVPDILAELGIDSLFDDVFGGDAFPVKKPDPMPLNHLREKYGLAQDELMMVGDSRNDILAAKNAGIASVGLTYGYNYGESIAISGPELVTGQFADLLTVLTGVKTR